MDTHRCCPACEGIAVNTLRSVILCACRTMRRWAFGTVLALSSTAPVNAQADANARRQSLDLTLGLSAVRGGRSRYFGEAGASLDVLLAIRRPSSHGFFGAMSAGSRFDADNTDDCVIALPETSCLPHAPTIRHLATLLGYEVRRGGASIRGLVGPSYFGVASNHQAGVRAQLSAAVGARRLALTSGVSGNVIAPFNGSSLRYVAGHFGLRMQ